MDASAIVSSSDHRPTLGHVSTGPLGDEHSVILNEIFDKGKKMNPLRRCRDAINDVFYTMFVCFNAVLKPELSEDLRMERTRPMSNEIKAIIFLLGSVGMCAILFLWAMVDVATAGKRDRKRERARAERTPPSLFTHVGTPLPLHTYWHTAFPLVHALFAAPMFTMCLRPLCSQRVCGPPCLWPLRSHMYYDILAIAWNSGATCEVLDYVQRDIMSGETKLVMRVMNKTQTTGSVFDDERQSLIDDGWISHHGPGENIVTDPGFPADNPFACHLLKTSLEGGPCCHSSFKNHRKEVGDVFDCSFTFDTDYCTDYTGDFHDDDFEGFHVNTDDPNDHRNRICCEVEPPLMLSRLVWLAVFGGSMTFIVLWCLMFRAKAGVWSRLRPFDAPPPGAHIHDVSHT